MEHNVKFPDADRIKVHFRKNKDKYLYFGLGAVVVLAIRKPITIAPVFSPVFNNSNQQINLAGPMTKMVECLETGEMWKKVTDAANAAGVGVSAMSKHLNGHVGSDHLYGKHYQIIGIGTTG